MILRSKNYREKTLNTPNKRMPRTGHRQRQKKCLQENLQALSGSHPLLARVAANAL